MDYSAMKSKPVVHSPYSICRRNFVRNASLSLAGLYHLKVKAFAAAIENTGLKDCYKDDFNIGAAISTGTFKNNDQGMLKLVAREFNSITTENALKWGVVHPNEDEWQFEVPDQFVDFREKHGMHILGHVLVWQSQVPHDLFKN